MEAKLTARLSEWREGKVGLDTLRDYYGLDLRGAPAEADVLRGRLQYWAGMTWPRPDQPRQNPVSGEKGSAEETWDRIVLELFFQAQQMVPWNWAAVSVGMDEPSLRATITALAKGQLFAPVTDFSGMLVTKEIANVLRQHLPKKLQSRTFADHNSWCEALHQAIRDKFSDISLQPLRCVTSERLGETSVDFASGFDALTDEPIGWRHVIWLDFGKPAALSPDPISTLTYLQHEETLKSFAMEIRQDPDIDTVRKKLRIGA